MSTIADNYKIILEKINNAALRSKRDPASVTLVAVSKTFPVEKILEAIQEPKKELSAFAPKIIVVKIKPEKKL